MLAELAQRAAPTGYPNARFWPETTDPDCPLFRRYRRESRRHAEIAKRS